jgi:GDPmannose 4,6-dehydratase
VGLSWQEPRLTNEVNFIGFLHLLEVCRRWNEEMPVAVYQASSSEMYGNQPTPQNEETCMTPRSPYGVSKLASHRMARVYRESFNLYVSTGICFNHESPRRGIEFVTRKIAAAAAEFAYGTRPVVTKPLQLGDINARRDWGYAPDFVEAMWLSLQQDEPDDYVIATGETRSVADFLEAAFARAGISPTPERVELGVEDFKRPAEVNELCGDASKVREKLGWEPSVKFEQLVQIMVDAEMAK